MTDTDTDTSIDNNAISESICDDENICSLRKGKKIATQELVKQAKGLSVTGKSLKADYTMTKPESFEQQNSFRSASTFIESIANEALAWRQALPEGHSPQVLAFLYGGISIKVSSLTKVSFSGIRIEGEYNGEPCALLAHQSTIQILCYGPKVQEPISKRPIGFFWDENEIEI
jgi:hypothetical protein